MFYLLRSSAIACDRLRSCDHMATKVLRSAIETYPIIFVILTDHSTLLSHKARMFVSNNAHLFQTWLALNMVTLLTRNLWRKLCGVSAFTTVIVRISKTNKKSNSWEKIGEKFNLSCLFMNIFRIQNDVSFGFEADVVVALGLKEEINLLAAKFPPRCPPCCLL